MLFILAACEPPGPTVTPTSAVDKSFTTTVSGTVSVTEKGGSTALEGVNVSALVDKKVVKTVQTDAGGKYSLAVTHKGDFTLRISADKYVVQSLTIKTEKGTFKQDIALEKVLASTTVSGNVTAPDSTPLVGVSISVKDRPEILPVTTAADGTYSGLEVSHSGSFTLRAVKDGYSPTIKILTPNTSPAAEQNFTLTLVGTPAFEFPQVRKSKMLVITNPNSDGTYSDQTYTNTLLYNGKAVTSGAVYSITKPTGITNEIGFDTATGQVSFGKLLYDKMTPSDLAQATGPPQTVTVQAAYQGKTASYTFTVTDHFSPRWHHRSVVLGSDIYVIGGQTRDVDPVTPSIPALQSNEVWRSGDGGLTWDQMAKGTRFPARFSFGSVVLGSDIYVIAGLGGRFGTVQRNDVWKSDNRGESWTRTAATVPFPMDAYFASAVLNNTILLMGGLRRSAPRDNINEVWKSSAGVSWSQVTTTGIFTKRQIMSSVVLGSGTTADPHEVYLIGGQRRRTLAVPAADLNDVWKSSDGVSWTHVNRTRPAPAPAPTRFPARRGHSSAAVKSAAGDIIYVIGGLGGSSWVRDVWKSTDKGVNWTLVTSTPQFGNRSFHSSVVQGGTVYVIGGNSSGSTGLHNDVWKSIDGGQTWTNVHKIN